MKAKHVDLLVTILFIIALGVLYFFRGCHLDIYVAIFAIMVVAFSLIISLIQEKKIKELTQPENNTAKQN